MNEIKYIYGPWFGLKFEKGTEIVFAFLEEDQQWMKIERIYYDEHSGEVRFWIDENPEVGHVRGYSLGTVRKFGMVTRNFFEHVGGKQACIALANVILKENKLEDMPL